MAKQNGHTEVNGDFLKRFEEWDIEEDLWNQAEFPRPSKESIAMREKIREEQLKEDKRQERLLCKKSIYENDSDYDDLEEQIAAEEIAADIAAADKAAAARKAAADALAAAYVDPCTIGCPVGYKKVRGRLLRIYVPEIRPGDEEAQKQEQLFQDAVRRQTQKQIREVSGLGFSNELIEENLKAKQKMGPRPQSPPNGLTPDLSFKTKAELEAMEKDKLVAPSSSSSNNMSNLIGDEMQIGYRGRNRQNIRSMGWEQSTTNDVQEINQGARRKCYTNSFRGRPKRLRDEELYENAEN